MSQSQPTGFARIAIVIPAFEPDAALPAFLEALKPLGYGLVVVVDDGSGPAYRGIFDAATRLGCTVLTHTQNRGKGRALKTAFEFCRTDAAISDVVTADSDGQHLVPDIEAVTNRLVANRRDGVVATVLGVRDFDQSEIPWKSRLGNKFTSRLVRILCGRYLVDTQTGLRGFPVEQLGDLESIRGERFDYEMNALLRLLRQRQPIEEVPISTVYHDMSNTQSHFRPIRDSIQVIAQILRFALSSLVGSGIDLGLYALLINVFFGGRDLAAGIVISVVVARLASATVNYLLNRNLVFHDRSRVRQSTLRYFIVAAVQLVASAVGSVFLAQLFAGHVVWAKIVTDTLLFVVSYVVQRRWVFAQDDSLRET